MGRGGAGARGGLRHDVRGDVRSRRQVRAKTTRRGGRARRSWTGPLGGLEWGGKDRERGKGKQGEDEVGYTVGRPAEGERESEV